MSLPPQIPPSSPTVSVVVCAYSDKRWPLLVEAIESVRGQRFAAHEAILVIDHSPELAARAQRSFPDVRIVENEQQRGLSGARNTGVRHSRGAIVAFLDDDARAAPDWLASLVAAFARPHVIGAGGRAEPVWDGPAPAWLPPEFLWVVGASYAGLPLELAPIRNPIGANMAFRREAFELAGGFTDGIGRIGRTPLGCEETEFSIRLRGHVPDALIMHVPGARVDHHVAAERKTLRYFVSRCWAEGLSKALVTAHVGRDQGLASERAYVMRTLPLGVVAGLRAARRGDRAGLARAAAILLGVTVTAAGYARGLATGFVETARRRRRSRAGTGSP
jgi:glycosyltransferase involved in cell wall biosynthesis